MQNKVKNLIEDFNLIKLSLLDMSISRLKDNKEVRSLFTELHKLMQSEHFFEIFIEAGFICHSEKTQVLQHKKTSTVWYPASPIWPLLNIFYVVLKGNNQDQKFSPKFLRLDNKDFIKYNESHKEQISQWDEIWGVDPTDLCIESSWICTSAGLDNELGMYLEKNCPDNENFFAIKDIYPTDEAKYDQFIEKFKDTTGKATALLNLSDGGHSESLFLIKDKDRKSCKVLTSGYLHTASKKIFSKYDITIRKDPERVKVIPDGNCSVHSELNINSILAKALEHNNSVYQVVDKIVNKKFSGKDFRIEFADIASGKNNKENPDAPTLARLLTIIGRYCVELQANGWFTFCKNKHIHPLHAVKSNYSEWESINYYLLRIDKNKSFKEKFSYLSAHTEDKADDSDEVIVSSQERHPKDEANDNNENATLPNDSIMSTEPNVIDKKEVIHALMNKAKEYANSQPLFLSCRKERAIAFKELAQILGREEITTFSTALAEWNKQKITLSVGFFCRKEKLTNKDFFQRHNNVFSSKQSKNTKAQDFIETLEKKYQDKTFICGK